MILSIFEPYHLFHISLNNEDFLISVFFLLFTYVTLHLLYVRLPPHHLKDLVAAFWKGIHLNDHRVGM